jgi:hypothetical protein
MQDCEYLELEAKIDKVWDTAVDCYRLAVKQDSVIYFRLYKNHSRRLASLMGEPVSVIENEVQSWVEFVEELN